MLASTLALQAAIRTARASSGVGEDTALAAVALLALAGVVAKQKRENRAQNQP
jgi:hypothetical protein